MTNYRKRPVIIQAEQWFPGKRIEGVITSPVLEPTPDNPSGAYGQIKTLEGATTCIPGDWIITGVKGEKYPCKPDIFHATYEPTTKRSRGAGSRCSTCDGWGVLWPHKDDSD